MKNWKNGASAVAESSKIRKTAFRPWPTSEKLEKWGFGRGRKLQNSENSVSAMADKQKTLKTTRHPRMKTRKWKK
ncbi:MAG: hypothetical protein ACTTJL_02345 [Hoylesella enoeca]